MIGLKSLNILTVLLVAIVLSSLLAAVHAQSQTITIDNAVQLFENYLTRLGNPNLALHQVEEYTNNFYASYYERNTGIFAFQMLIWKPGSIWTGGMMGNGMMSGFVMPEPGPNIMWNTKYGVTLKSLTPEEQKINLEAGKQAQEYMLKKQESDGHGAVRKVWDYYMAARTKYEDERARKK